MDGQPFYFLAEPVLSTALTIVKATTLVPFLQLS